jgi:hypothetical protein
MGLGAMVLGLTPRLGIALPLWFYSQEHISHRRSSSIAPLLPPSSSCLSLGRRRLTSSPPHLCPASPLPLLQQWTPSPDPACSP